MLPFCCLQIRQYQRGHYGGGKAERSLNEIISGRPCGGSHTVMYHPKRRTKTTQLNQVLGLFLTNYSTEYISCFQYIKIIKTIKIKLIKGKNVVIGVTQ